MKFKILQKSLLTTGIVLFFAFNMLSQDWHPPVELVNTGEENEMPSIAAFNSMVHVAWEDTRGVVPFPEIYYKRSTDFGLTWEPGKKLSDMPAGSGPTYPKLAVRDNFVHLVWAQYNTIHDQVYYCRSSDDGGSFTGAIEISAPPADIKYPDIAVFENHVHIVYLDIRLAPVQSIYYIRSDDNGNTWTLEKLLTVDGQIAYKPKIAVSGQNVFVSWNEQTNNPSEMCFIRSLDNGENWDPPVLLSNTGIILSQHDIAAANDHDVHVVWEDRRDGGLDEIYYKVSHDAGANWEPEIRLTFAALNSSNPSITAINDKIFLVWDDMMAGTEQVYFMQSENGGVDWTEPLRLNENTGLANYPSLAAFSDDVFVAWTQGVVFDLKDVYFRRRIDHTPVDENGIPGTNDPVLYQNYPNPFNGSTNINIYLPDQAFVSIKVYNAVGKDVAVIGNKDFTAGKHTLEWDANGLPPGIYYLKLTMPNNSIQSRKMLLK